MVKKRISQHWVYTFQVEFCQIGEDGNELDDVCRCNNPKGFHTNVNDALGWLEKVKNFKISGKFWEL